MSAARDIAAVKPSKRPAGGAVVRRKAGRNKGDVTSRPPPRHPYGDFDQWVELGARLAEYYHELIDVIESIRGEDASTPAPDAKSWPLSESPEPKLKRCAALNVAAQTLLARFSAADLADALATFADGHRRYEGDEYYDPPEHQVVSRRFVAERIAMMAGAFPNASPGNPALYTYKLVEEMIAADATATQVEWTTRKLAREQVFLPTLPELLRTLRAARTPEYDDAFRMDEGTMMIVWARSQLARMLGAKALPRLAAPEGEP
jgi:hypothetical protein